MLGGNAYINTPLISKNEPFTTSHISFSSHSWVKSESFPMTNKHHLLVSCTMNVCFPVSCSIGMTLLMTWQKPVLSPSPHTSGGKGPHTENFTVQSESPLSPAHWLGSNICANQVGCLWGERRRRRRRRRGVMIMKPRVHILCVCVCCVYRVYLFKLSTSYMLCPQISTCAEVLPSNEETRISRIYVPVRLPLAGNISSNISNGIKFVTRK